MNTYQLPWQFEEYGLPKNQKTIITTGVTQFTTTTDLILDAKALNDRPMMGLVTGSLGSGKTCAMQYYMRQLELRAYTMLPACIDIRIPPEASSKALVETVFKRFGEKARRTNNRYQILMDARDAVLDHDIKLIFADEAEQLNTQGFEFLRYIFDTTGCAIMFIGSKEILQKIRFHENIREDIGTHLKFPEPEEEEVIKTILPQLTFAHWNFDPANEKDVEMGKLLWESVKPSFRNLCNVLNSASTLVHWQERKGITKRMLKAGFLSGLPQSRKNAPLSQLNDEEEEKEEDQEDTEHSDYEKSSEDRKREKNKRRKRKATDAE
jgi:Cdc6-like AAA superfamily ATPase